MKVRIIATGKIEEHAAIFAVRLIEQGKALMVNDEPEKKGKK